MLDDVNKLLLAEQEKPNILTFSIQLKNKHHFLYLSIQVIFSYFKLGHIIRNLVSQLSYIIRTLVFRLFFIFNTSIIFFISYYLCYFFDTLICSSRYLYLNTRSYYLYYHLYLIYASFIVLEYLCNISQFFSHDHISEPIICPVK